MKQMKLFLVALMTVVMGVSVSSCMKGGEGSTVVPVTGFITLKNTFPYEFRVDGSTVSFIANGITMPGLSADAYPGDVVFLSASYDTKTQAIDQNSTKIYVDVDYALKVNVNATSDIVENKAEAADLANRSIVPLSNYNGSPFMYVSDWVIIPIPFYTEKEENLTQHSFTLAYINDEEVKNSVMKLHLYHKSLESVDKEKVMNISLTNGVVKAYKAFKISSLIAAFKQKNGAAPREITIVTQEYATASVIAGETTDKFSEKEYTVKDYKATE